MGDKGSRKDKHKSDKQKQSKDAQKAREKQDKQPKDIPEGRPESVQEKRSQFGHNAV